MGVRDELKAEVGALRDKHGDDVVKVALGDISASADMAEILLKTGMVSALRADIGPLAFMSGVLHVVAAYLLQFHGEAVLLSFAESFKRHSLAVIERQAEREKERKKAGG